MKNNNRFLSLTVKNNNMLLYLLVVLTFFLGQFVAMVGFGLENGWEIIIGFTMCLIIGIFAGSLSSPEDWEENSKEEQVNLPNLRAE